MKIKIVADQRIPYVDAAFGPFGKLIKLDSRAIDNAAVKDADALIVRSETKVDEKLLTGSKVQFVGTATIGTDHIDLDFLSKSGIKFASAPGCNAYAVMQYITAVLLTLAARRKHTLEGKILGVVGVGNVGSKIVKVGQTLGMKVLQNDPPLARSTGEPGFFPLDDLMGADFITVHVPFTKTGTDPTFHLFDGKRISMMRKGSTLINTSRGAVVDNKALKEALKSKLIGDAVLDVWENEPNIDVELLSLCALGTQHIAGYSIDGKVNATTMIYREFCKHFERPQDWDSSHVIPPPKEPEFSFNNNTLSEESALLEAVRHCYEIEKDDDALRKISSIPDAERGLFFKKLRGNYNFRYEFSNMTVDLPVENQQLAGMLGALGFKISGK